MTVTTFKRYEKKFLLSSEQYRSILPVLMLHMKPDENCRDGREYIINNIYYDTDTSDIIRHSLCRPYYKEKLRLRSYGGPISPGDMAFLELKKKIGGVVSKRRAVLTLEQAEWFLATYQYPAGIDYMNIQVLNEIEFFLRRHKIRPLAYISCKRSALLGRDDRDLRITIDHDIVTRREQLSLGTPRFGSCLLQPGQYLMEIKVAQAFPLWLARLLSGHHVYPTSYSKYGREYQQFRQGATADNVLKTAI